MESGLKAKMDRLCSLHTFGVKLGLDRVRALLDRLGNPERELAAVHVAGTNGKGSVCAMLDSVFRAAGLKTGLYTSPHLVRFNERVRIAGRCIPDGDLSELIDLIEPHAAAVEKKHGEVSFFEFTTALAFEYFRREGVRLAVLETGMGGRLDATNVVTPALSVITGISLEHTQYLGPDIPSIAAEKGGIIKTGRPVVCGAMDPDAMAVLAGIAAASGSELVTAPGAVEVRRLRQDASGQKIKISSNEADYPTFVLPLAGRHQLANAATAVAALEVLASTCGIVMEPGIVARGLSSVGWPGRLQVLSVTPLGILDGAHNPGAAAVLAAAIGELAPKRPVALVFGMCSDKDAAGFLRPFAGMVKMCRAVDMRTERSAPARQLAGIAAGILAADSQAATLEGAIAESEKWAGLNNGVVCIAGSLYLVGEVLELKGIVPFG